MFVVAWKIWERLHVLDEVHVGLGVGIQARGAGFQFGV